MLASSLAKDLVLQHRLTSPLNLAFHLLFGAAAVAGILLRGRKAQLTLAIFGVASFSSYVAILFARL